MEFQAVIMAAGRGSRMLDLTSKIPKPLLSIANKPLIWYSVNYLEKSGFEEVTIVTLESLKEDIFRALVEENDVQIVLNIIGIKDDNEWGTADSLRFIADKINCDNILVISCDTITFIPLQLLANVHRTKDSSLTVLLTSRPSQIPDANIGPKSKIKYERDIIGLNDEERLLIYGAEADFEDKIILKHSFLINYPNFNIYTTLMDCHMYMIKKWIITYIIENKKISSIKGDLIPKLIQKRPKILVSQYSSDNLNKSFSTQSSALNYITKNLDLTIINDNSDNLGSSYLTPSLQMGDSINNTLSNSPKQSAICYDLASKPYLDTFYKNTETQEKSHTLPNFFAYVYSEIPSSCIRVHTFHEYCLANKLVAKSSQMFFDDQKLQHKSNLPPDANIHISNDSLLEQCTLKENVNIKKSIIGKHCSFENNVKITNSIIGNHVIIRENSNINNSVILNHCELGKNCEIKDSFIGCSQNLPDKSKMVNEELLDRVFMEI
ncbi:unnamed protein product [Gordionus sp. m RMFG-2023]